MFTVNNTIRYLSNTEMFDKKLSNKKCIEFCDAKYQCMEKIKEEVML